MSSPCTVGRRKACPSGAAWRAAAPQHRAGRLRPRWVRASAADTAPMTELPSDSSGESCRAWCFGGLRPYSEGCGGGGRRYNLFLKGHDGHTLLSPIMRPPHICWTNICIVREAPLAPEARTVCSYPKLKRRSVFGYRAPWSSRFPFSQSVLLALLRIVALGV